MNQIWNRIIRHIVATAHFGELELGALLHPFGRTQYLRRHTASVIIARIQLISTTFALLVPLWGCIDLLVFPAGTASGMFLLRLCSAALFFALAWPRELSPTSPYLQAMVMLLLMLMVPPAFYLLSLRIIDHQSLDLTQRLVAKLYMFMPTIALGGIAIFPLTALETVLISLPLLSTAIIGINQGSQPFNLLQDGASLWFMLLMVGLAAFSGMSQSYYIATRLLKTSSDPLTSAYTRQSGSKALDLMLRLATRGEKPLSIVFLDIDHFKAINDCYGHLAGDRTLQALADHILYGLRRSDLLIRWGGEEFVAVLPDTSISSVKMLMQRLRSDGFGLRPDGTPVTASIGVAERIADGIDNWPALIALADSRMYEAKRQGRDRIVWHSNIFPPCKQLDSAPSADSEST